MGWKTAHSVGAGQVLIHAEWASNLPSTSSPIQVMILVQEEYAPLRILYSSLDSFPLSAT